MARCPEAQQKRTLSNMQTADTPSFVPLHVVARPGFCVAPYRQRSEHAAKVAHMHRSIAPYHTPRRKHTIIGSYSYAHTNTYLQVDFLLSAARELLHVRGELDTVFHRLDLKDGEGTTDPTRNKQAASQVCVYVWHLSAHDRERERERGRVKTRAHEKAQVGKGRGVARV